MALLFMDGFSHYQTSDILRKWTSFDSTACTFTIVPGEGRNGGCLKRTSNANTGNSGIMNKVVTSRQTGPWTTTVSGVCGFAVKIDDLNRITPTLGSVGFQTRDVLFVVTNGAWSMCSVMANPDGTLSLRRQGDAGILANSIGALVSNTWSYLEFKWTLSETTGSMIIRSNGIVVMNYTGILFPSYVPNPKPTLEWTSIQWMGCQSTVAPFLIMRGCDFYLLDQTGTVNNDFLGDISITYIIPDAVGATSAWTPTPAVPNWQNVDEVPGNDDTDYNTATTPGTIDLYSFTPVSTNPLAAQHSILSRRTAPGSATLASLYQQGSSFTHAAAQAVPAETYNYCIYPYDTNPATSARFTAAEINANQFGVNKAT